MNFRVLSSPLWKIYSCKNSFFFKKRKHIYIASLSLNCASLAKEFPHDSDAMNGAVIMGFRRAQSSNHTGIVPLTAELELCLYKRSCREHLSSVFLPSELAIYYFAFILVKHSF